MSMEIPKDLQNLQANGGVFAIWMVFHHYGVDLDISDLAQLCKHNDQDGTFGISLAAALKKLGLDVEFYTAHDPAPHSTEVQSYLEAQALNISLHAALSYEQLQEFVAAGRFVIVYYDTLEGIGNHSLIYSMDDQEVCFFDSFDPMSAEVFEQQRKKPGICQQAIVIDDRNFVMREDEVLEE
ncbi:MAG: cysteine peptidase family C39 domain-containing protein [Acinetobacter sp.]|uniref:cysteine peptidase family C39 domain-containing protein n=1 Tax=Acinetobacter sp. TaxID=472 RepID=UPI003D0322D6